VVQTLNPTADLRRVLVVVENKGRAAPDPTATLTSMTAGGGAFCSTQHGLCSPTTFS
jgi:hypothetical protein